MNVGFQKFFSDAANGWLPYILALNVIGGISMAMLQTAKDLFPMRRAFQRRELKKWFEAGAGRVNAHMKDKGFSARKGENTLLDLAANADFKAFFDLQIEDLCGLFNATIQVVLESSTLYEDLLWITASRAELQDVKVVAGPIPTPMNQAYLDARNRVLHQCQRAIGAFQVDCDFRWKWMMQLLALVLSTLLALAALSSGAVRLGPTTVMSASPFSVIATALLAGFLAPVAKDLLAIVQKARGQ
jgi:hypothetical protein